MPTFCPDGSISPCATPVTRAWRRTQVGRQVAGSATTHYPLARSLASSCHCHPTIAPHQQAALHINTVDQSWTHCSRARTVHRQRLHTNTCACLPSCPAPQPRTLLAAGGVPVYAPWFCFVDLRSPLYILAASSSVAWRSLYLLPSKYIAPSIRTSAKLDNNFL